LESRGNEDIAIGLMLNCAVSHISYSSIYRALEINIKKVTLFYNVVTSFQVRNLTSSPFVNRNIQKTVHSYRTSTT